MVLRGLFRAGAAAFQFLLDIVDQAGKFRLRADIADAQMLRFLRQVEGAATAEEDRRAVALGAKLEPVHAARRDEDCVMCAKAAGDAADRDPALTAREPQQQRFGERAHRLDPPAAACGKARDGHDTDRRGFGRLGQRDKVMPRARRLFRLLGELRQRRAGEEFQRFRILGSGRVSRPQSVCVARKSM